MNRMHKVHTIFVLKQPPILLELCYNRANCQGDDKMQFEEKTTHQRIVFNGRIFNVIRHDVQLPNGKTSVRDIVEHSGAVAVIAIVDEQLVLVRQYRKALGKAILEIPAGLRDHADESLVQTASRELIEETQLTAEAFHYVSDMVLSPGFSTEIVTIYEAIGVKLAQHLLPQDDDEHIEVVYLTREQVDQAMASGEICDAKTLYAIQYWDLKRKMHEK